MKTDTYIAAESLAQREILIVDAHVEDADVLLRGLARPIEIVRLKQGRSALEQLSSTLGSRQGIETLHILSHGEPGALALCGEKLGASSILANPTALETIKPALIDGARVALWACSAAAGAVGRSFVETLEAATGTQVFASDHPVGSASGGGTWNIGIPSPFAPAAMAAYPHTLPTFDGDGGGAAGTDYTEADNGDGITLTVTFNGDTAQNIAAGGGGGSTGNVFAATGFSTTSATVNFSSPVTITSFIYFEADTIASAGNYTYTVTTGSGAVFALTEADFTATAGFDGLTVTPDDWFGVTQVTITSTASGFTPALDTLVYNVNTTPTVSTNNAALAYSEGDAATLIDSAGTVSDPDGDGDWNTGTLVAQITANNEAADQISISDTDGDGTTITISGTDILANGVDVGNLSTSGGAVTNGTALTITWDEDATNAIVQEVLQSLRYESTSEGPGESNRTITVTATDGTGASAVDTRIVDVASVNDDPTISGLVSDIGLTEDTAGNLDLSASAFADVDSAGSITVTLTASEGTMAASSGGSVTVGGSGTGTLTLSGTVSNINTYLDTASNILYTGSLNDNGGDTATISVTANDGDGSGDLALGTVNLDIASVNDLPTATGNTAVMNEDTSRVFTAADFNFADVDTGDTLASVRIDTLTVGSGTFQLSGVDISASDVIAVADINAGNLVFTPAADANGTDLLIFTFSVNDGSAFSAASSSFNVNVTDISDPVSPVQIVVVADPTNMSNQRLRGDSLGDRLGGGSGNDTISGGGGVDTLTGGAGNDIIAGGGGGDTLTGGAGNDFITGGSGHDVSFAGPGDEGDDTVQGNLGNDIIGGGAGDDILVGGTLSNIASNFNIGVTGDDILFGGEGNDLLVAGSYNSATDTVVNSGQGNNILWAGGGNDTVFGDDEADTVGGGAGDDSVNAGDGNDAVFGGTGNDRVDAGAGNDSAFAGSGNDLLDGGDGDDTLFGGAGDDTVAGGAGDDDIWAGAGNDTLSGGAGSDTFLFGNTSGNDTVSDFNTAEDILNLAFASTDFNSLTDVTAAASETSQNGQAGVLIALGDSDSVFVIGIGISELTSSNVSF